MWLLLFFSIMFIAGLFYSFVRIESYNLNPNTAQVTSMTHIYNAIDNTFWSILTQGKSVEYSDAKSQILSVYFVHFEIWNRCFLSSSLLSFRILAGTWALGCFLLVNYYDSILTSFFTAPNYQPLIKSIYDLPKHPGIKITTNEISLPMFAVRVSIDLSNSNNSIYLLS